MALTADEVRYIARLARLQVTDDEVAQLALEMGKVLDYIDQLNRLDTTDISPMSHVLDFYNVFREDAPVQRITHEEALRNAPDADGDYFRVPKVIE